MAPVASLQRRMGLHVEAHTVPPDPAAMAAIGSECDAIVKSLEDKIAVFEKDLAEAREIAAKAQLVAEGHQREVQTEKAFSEKLRSST